MNQIIIFNNETDDIFTKLLLIIRLNFFLFYEFFALCNNFFFSFPIVEVVVAQIKIAEVPIFNQIFGNLYDLF